MCVCCACVLTPPFPSAMGSDKNKELFLSQVEQILEGVKQDRDKVTMGCGVVNTN